LNVIPGVFDEAFGLGTTILLVYPIFDGDTEDGYDGL
jgi:hypothetical protein